jgi:YHS domain-containing protein
MFRFILYLLFFVLAISVLKGIIRIVLKGVGAAMQPEARQAGAARPSSQVPLAGELKKDPVCGTYIATASSVKETVGGQTVHFCSRDCRDKYVATAAR